MKRFPLHVQILVAMALGAALGLFLNFQTVSEGGLSRETVLELAAVGEWLGKLFLALLQMVVVPLIFSSLVYSIAGLGERKGMAALGLRTVAYYLTTSLLAITVGIIVVNLVRPGEGLNYNDLMLAAQSEMATQQQAPPTGPEILEQQSPVVVLVGIVFRMVPTNIVEAASSNGTILSVIFFALLFGIFIVRTGGEQGALLAKFFGAVQEVMMRMTHTILYVAPIGIFGYVFYVTAATGLALASALGWYMVAVAVGLAFHAFVTLPLILWLVGGRNPLHFVRDMWEALATAFSTASSAGTLPLTMRCATQNAGLPDRVTSFTLPLGATVNMDGTALYEAVAVLFVAQMLGDLTIGQQVIVAVTALLASVGAAGIPHAGTVMMVIVMQAVGLPTEAVLVILAVDRVLDMCRTTVNVWSDSVGAAVVTRWEPLDQEPAVPADVATHTS
ncbi:MAG: dicarboxylate/amino acid:cation symporter [Deltaproteobacteria bacterium]|nr:dicarboxylate/amino acid:cation symporter [Deltaproteobacteria bacterium]MBW2253053.1 dicarboxylate/amino acid:cation symporter [Deltaproteobacteria bacterium]